MTKSCTAPAEARADEQPKATRQQPELRGEHRADEGPGARDGGEVVAEGDVLVHRHVVAAVVEAHGGGDARVG